MARWKAAGRPDWGLASRRRTVLQARRSASFASPAGNRRAALVHSDEIVIGMSPRMWKEGAPNTAARPRRAPCHNVARSVADVDPGREVDADRARGEAPQDYAYGSKGRLMRFQVMRSGAAALALSLALGAGAAVAQTQPAKPAPGLPLQPGQPQQPAPRRRSTSCRPSRNGQNSAPRSRPPARTPAPPCATSRPRPISRR